MKSSLSTRLKNTSRLECPNGGFQDDLRAMAVTTLKSCEGSFLKPHLVLSACKTPQNPYAIEAHYSFGELVQSLKLPLTL